jgi:hypothetical protein
MPIDKASHQTLGVLLRNITYVDNKHTVPFWSGPFGNGFLHNALQAVPAEEFESYREQYMQLSLDTRFDTLTLYTEDFVDWFRTVWFDYAEANK